MGAMRLIEVVQELGNLDEESTIYAAKPWTENSETMVLLEPESGILPDKAKSAGLVYFLEVSIAKDFLEDWSASHEKAPDSRSKCLRLIQYAINDA